jgi:hypothetical protein
LDDAGEFYAHIKLHIGDVVIIKEEDNESYAIIGAIFTHKYNDELVYAFVWIDWLTNTEHIVTGFTFPRDTCWDRIGQRCVRLFQRVCCLELGLRTAIQ